MTAPAHSLTWQFQCDQLVAPTATVLASNQALMFACKSSLIGAGVWVDKDNVVVASAGNCTVTSSCDGSGGAGSFGNNDNVDRWVTSANLIWAAAASNHSWGVFQQTGIAARFQVCIDLSSAVSTTATIVVSPTAGFGAANGGADGTATARPTATDERVLVSNTTWGGPASVNFGSILHVMKTADGKCMRVFVMRDTVVYGYWQFEQPANPVTGWTDPSASAAVGLGTTGAPGTSAIPQTFFGTSFNQWSKTAGGTSFSSVCLSEGDLGASATNSLLFLNEADNSYPNIPVGLFSITVAARGINGVLRDRYWASNQLANGFTAPKASGAGDAAARKWIVLGPFFHPWNSTKPRVRV